MDLQADLKWIHQQLENIEDPTFIEIIKNMLLYRQKVEGKRISVSQYNTELEISEKEIVSGNFHTQNEVREIAAKWERNNLVSHNHYSIRTNSR